VKIDLPKWKIGLDTANGAQTVLIPHLLEEIGHGSIKVNCDFGRTIYSKGFTDTSDKAAVEKLQELVKKEKM